MRPKSIAKASPSAAQVLRDLPGRVRTLAADATRWTARVERELAAYHPARPDTFPALLRLADQLSPATTLLIRASKLDVEALRAVQGAPRGSAAVTAARAIHTRLLGVQRTIQAAWRRALAAIFRSPDRRTRR